jgi:hypothetical protein
MDLQLTVSFIGEHDEDDLALLLEAIAGEVRQGSTAGTTGEYSWKLA